MASSKVMKTSSNTPPTTTTISDLHLNYNHNYAQMIPNNAADVSQLSVDNLFQTDADISMIDAAGAIECPERKTAEDVWREIVDGGSRKECKVEEEMMTLEDFLARATAEDVEVKEEEYAAVTVAMAVGGRGKRSRGGGGGGVVMECMDKATQQRQRRMIKNRESAARSRERKQAYQVELEALAAKLEEENELLLKEKADRTKQRYQQWLSFDAIFIRSSGNRPYLAIGESLLRHRANGEDRSGGGEEEDATHPEESSFNAMVDKSMLRLGFDYVERAISSN